MNQRAKDNGDGQVLGRKTVIKETNPTRVTAVTSGFPLGFMKKNCPDFNPNHTADRCKLKAGASLRGSEFESYPSLEDSLR